MKGKYEASAALARNISYASSDRTRGSISF
jgi:hypothetical protein